MLVSTLTLAAAAAALQTAPPQTKSDAPEIVVQGEPEPPKEGAVEDRMPFGVDPLKSAHTFDHATRAAKCATKRRIADPALLREAVDGQFNSSRHDQAVATLVRVTRACGEGAFAPDFRATAEQTVDLKGTNVGSLDGTPPIIGPRRGGQVSTTEAGVLYRGAFIIAALDTYAPDLKLTRAMLLDPTVRQRLSMREAPKLQQRLPADREYAAVAMCFVERDPESAQRLLSVDHLDGGSKRLAARLIDRGRDCVGGRRVVFNPPQLRVYVAEAVYRWAVAVRGTSSLIPLPARAVRVDAAGGAS